MKVVYLTWGETPRNDGVYGSQVIKLVQLLSDNEIKIELVAGLPILNRKLFEFNKKKEDSKIVNEILLLTSQYSYFLGRISKLLHRYVFNILLYRRINKIDPDIIHCRSYPATLAAIIYRENFNSTIKIIFDPRGNYPEEVAFKKGITNISNRYFQFLKKLEMEIISKSDAIVSVSETMVDQFQSEYKVKSHFIPLMGLKNQLEKTIKKTPGVLRFCYIGYLNQNSWHTIESFNEICLQLLDSFFDCEFLILTKSNPREIQNNLSKEVYSRTNISSFTSESELKSYIKDVHFGLIPFNNNPMNFANKIISYTMLGTKTVEYISLGLPIIVNNKCGGASRLVEKYGIGISYKNNDPNLKESIEEALKNSDMEKHLNEASKLFRPESITEKYLSLYNSLMSEF